MRGQGDDEHPPPPDVVLDRPAHLPDGYVPDDDVKLDLYRRLARATSSGEIDGLRDEMRERFGPLPAEAETLLDMARLRVLGAALGLQHVLVRGDEARLTFRAGTTPRLAGLTSALDDVQLAAEVRRTVPLSLRLTRLGGELIVPALVRALKAAVTVTLSWRCHATQCRSSRRYSRSASPAARTSAISSRRTPIWPPRPAARSSRRSGWRRSWLRRKGVQINRETAELRRQRLDRLRAVWPGRGAGQAAGRLGQHRGGRVARDLRAKGKHWHDTLMARRARCLRRRGRQPVHVDRHPRAASTSCSGAAPTRCRRSRPRPRRRRRPPSPRSGRAPISASWPRSSREDPGSKADSGFLPPSPKGRFVPAFDSGAGPSRRGR